jgi:hypothetical protein
MEKELTGLLKDPACGKSDMRSEVIDGMTRLVSDGIVKPEEAVKQLGDFPERPFSQRQWLQQHVLQFQQAENQVLDHYRIGVMANGGQSDGAEYNPDDHASVMAGLMSHYGRR